MKLVVTLIVCIDINSGFYKVAVKSERVIIPEISPKQIIKIAGKIEASYKRMINRWFHR